MRKQTTVTESAPKPIQSNESHCPYEWYCGVFSYHRKPYLSKIFFDFPTVQFCIFLYVSVCFCLFLFVSVNFWLFLFFLSVSVCFCPFYLFLSVLGRCWPFLFISVCIYPFLSVSVHFCPLLFLSFLVPFSQFVWIYMRFC